MIPDSNTNIVNYGFFKVRQFDTQLSISRNYTRIHNDIVNMILLLVSTPERIF